MNEVIGAARAVRRNLGSGGAGQAQLGEQSQTAMRVKNNTGSALSRFAVVGIDGILIDATTNMSSFSDQPCLLGVATTEGGQYAVCLDAIPSGGIGMAAVDGVVQARVSVSDADHNYATCGDGGTTLTSGATGDCRIIYKPSGTGTLWCIVRLGSRPVSFPAKLTGAAAYSGSSYRWKYAWEEVVDDGDDVTTVTNGRSGTTSTDYALNDFERFHTSTIAGGVALDGDDYPAGFAPMPIGGAGPLSSGDGIWRYSVVVQMHERWDATNSKWVYRFSAPISHDGTCEAAT
jgi:hypothetical protein